MPIFSVVFTYFQLRFCYVLKQRKPGMLWVRCPFSRESGLVPLICHLLLTKQNCKTYIGGCSYSSTTDNLLDFCTAQTKNWVVSTDTNLLSFIVPWSVDETSSVAYNSGETRACNKTYHYFFPYISVLIQSGEFLASVWQEEGNFEVLERCYIQIYPAIVFLLC